MALYFALRNRGQDAAKYAEVWALDLAQLMPRVQEIGSKAERNALHNPARRRRINFGDPDSYASLL